MTRRSFLAAPSAFAACPDSDRAELDFTHLPASAHAIADDLRLGEGAWMLYREQQRKLLLSRIDEGSAEHVTYYVLQSLSFTRHAPIDPVRLAAAKPTQITAAARERFDDFLAQPPADERGRIVRELFRNLPPSWTAEACFAHTLRFLNERSRNQQSARDELYQRRGLSSDTTPNQTLVIDRALAHLGPPQGRTLLIGPGLDLTRREAFRDDIPLQAYQVDRLLAATALLDCADVRPEVLAFLKQRPVCPLHLDISTTAASAHGRYSLIIVTNVLLYLDDQALFAAMAGFARSLAPGGHLVHNDVRFATKVFGEVLGLPAVHYESISLGKRQGIELLDRAVLHRRI